MVADPSGHPASGPVTMRSGPQLSIPGAEVEARRIGLSILSVLALLVGIVTGLGAVLFRDLIGFVHILLFLGQFAFRFDANVFTPPSPW